MERKKENQVVSLKATILKLKKRLKEMVLKEKSLLTQEYILQDIFDIVEEGISYTSLDGKVISINRALEAMLEIPREKIIGRNILALATEHLDARELKNILPVLKRIIAGKWIKPFQVAFRHKTLEIRTYRNPKTRTLTGIVRDMTENIETISALSKSEARLRRAELASKSGNWELHLDTGKITGSEGARKLYGIESESIDYKDIRGIPLPEYRQMMDDALNDLITKNKSYNLEFKIRKVNSDEIIDIHSISEYDPANRILYGSIQDITDRKKIEEKLLKKNRDLSRLFAMSLHLLEFLDKKEVLLKIVEEAASLVGTDTSAIYLIKEENLYLEVTSPPLPADYPDEFRIAKLNNHPHIKKVVESRNIFIINDISNTELTPEEKLIAEVRNLGSLVYIPLIVQKKVEGVIILGTIGRTHDFEPDEIDLFSTFSNITSLALENSYLYENLRIAMEKAEESNKLKSAFLHNISHEIRTPLNAIIGFSGILGQENLKAEMRDEYVNIITQSNNQLLAIIDDILNISHIEAGQVLVNESSTNLNLILKNLYSQFHPEATRKGIAFTLNTPSLKQDQDIMTDEFKVIGIITNLLNNAFKFTHEGSVELGCTHGEDFSEIYVKDTGIGIPESEHERIFSRFYQIDKSPSRVYAGMGLGLAICKAYVDLLGGRITVDSSPGRGSTFSFTLPRKIAYPDIPVKEKDRADSRDVLAFGRTVLVAEDEDSAFAFIREVLNPLGIKTLRAFNGLEAIDVCRSNPDIELVLMDIRMPVKDGYESASEILKFRPQLPIIAQTAYGYPRDRKSATEKGCIDQLTKPFNKDQLISMITKHLK